MGTLTTQPEHESWQGDTHHSGHEKRYEAYPRELSSQKNRGTAVSFEPGPHARHPLVIDHATQNLESIANRQTIFSPERPGTHISQKNRDDDHGERQAIAPPHEFISRLFEGRKPCG